MVEMTNEGIEDVRKGTNTSRRMGREALRATGSEEEECRR
jgi:hypothetical protein